MPTFKTAEGILFSLGILLIMLITLYGVAHLITRFSPTPVSGWFNKIVSLSTPAGWVAGSSNS